MSVDGFCGCLPVCLVAGLIVDASFFSISVFPFWCSCMICLGVVALGKLPLDARAFGLNHVSPIHADPSTILF